MLCLYDATEFFCKFQDFDFHHLHAQKSLLLYLLHRFLFFFLHLFFYATFGSRSSHRFLSSFLFFAIIHSYPPSFILFSRWLFFLARHRYERIPARQNCPSIRLDSLDFITEKQLFKNISPSSRFRNFQRFCSYGRKEKRKLIV